MLNSFLHVKPETTQVGIEISESISLAIDSEEIDVKSRTLCARIST